MLRVLTAGCVVAILAAFAHAADPTRDDVRLLRAERDPGNWLTYSRDYSNQRFSPLTQINTRTVARLAPRWIYQSGVSSTFQASPIVVDGVMYLSLPFNHVVALDARTGHELWRYQHKRRAEKMCCGPANRGVAVAYGKVYIGTVDARLIALDQKTGKVVWDVALVDDLGKGEGTEQLAADDPLRKQRVSGAIMRMPAVSTVSRFGQRYAIGVIRENGKTLFVSSGIGTSILPLRFGVPPEISLLTLE